MHISRWRTRPIRNKNALACLFFFHQHRAKLNISSRQISPHSWHHMWQSKRGKKNTFISKQGNMQRLINKPPISPFVAQPFYNMKGNTENINSDYSKWPHFQKCFQSLWFWRPQGQRAGVIHPTCLFALKNPRCLKMSLQTFATYSTSNIIHKLGIKIFYWNCQYNCRGCTKNAISIS